MTHPQPRLGRFPRLASYSVSGHGPTDIVLIADGWQREAFLNALQQGWLDEIGEILLEGGTLFESVISNVPSVSIASHASILTGSYQDEHGLPGHRWVAESDCSCHNYLRMAGPRSVNRDLARDIKTVFESPQYDTSISVQNVVSRGATVRRYAPTLRSGPIFSLLAELVIAHPNSFASAWLPRVDALSHRHGPEHRKVLDEMRETSRNFGLFANRLKRAGLLDNARILLIPDHGQHEVKHGTDLRSELAQLKYDAAVNPRRPKNSDVIAMTSGDAAAYLYARNGLESADLASRVAELPSIELVCVREPDGLMHFLSHGAHSSAQVAGDSLLYKAEAGRDPLDLLGPESREILLNPTSVGRLDSKYPDFLHQYSRSHVPGRSSEVLVFAARDTNFQNAPRIGYRAGYHRGTHGGPFGSDVVVSAAARGWPSESGSRPVRSADLLRLLGILPERARVGAALGAHRP